MNPHPLFSDFIVAFILSLFIAIPVLIAHLVQARRHRHRDGFTAAANIGEGTREFDSLVPDVNIPVRYLLAKRGSSTLNFTLPTALTDRPIGVCEDQSSQEAIGLTPGLPFRINRLGTGMRSKKVAIASTVAQDDILVSAGNGFAETLPSAAGTYWVIGQADQAGAASGDNNFPTVIEFIGILPYQLTH